MNDFSAEIRGDGFFFSPIIQTKNPLRPELTISNLYNSLIKTHKNKLLPTSMPYIYVMTQDNFCGFVPLPDQTLIELAKIYGNNNHLIIKITEKPFFG